MSIFILQILIYLILLMNWYDGIVVDRIWVKYGKLSKAF